MIPEFGSWYRAVQIEPNDDRLQKRWKAVEKAAKGCSSETALELARVFNGFPAENEPWLVKFKNRFQEEDSAFDTDSVSAELIVLAGAAIAQVLASSGEAADIVAMAAQVAAFGLPHEKRKIPAIRARIDSHLIKRGVALRTPPTRRPTPKDRSKKIDAVSSALQSGHAPASEPIKTVLTELSDQIDAVDERLIESERIRQESSGILWWLMGAYSETLAVPFSTAPVAALPVVCAFELAQLTRASPGLPNAKAFLLQVLGSRALQDMTTIEWIRAVDRPIRERLLGHTPDSQPSPLCPVLDGMRRSLELADDEIWMADCARRGASYACSAIDIAEQFHRELLLNRRLRSTAQESA